MNNTDPRKVARKGKALQQALAAEAFEAFLAEHAAQAETTEV